MTSRTQHIRLGLLVAALFAAGPACVQHVRPYVPKQRMLDLPSAGSPTFGSSSDNSLWHPDSEINVMLPDARAFRVNDLVVVVIDEKTVAERDTSTETRKGESYETKLDEMLGVMRAMEIASRQRFDGGKALALSHKADFKGQGKTQRHDRVEATVPALVKRVYGNGSIFVEGHRVVLVNGEENHLYVSGIARPIDIDMDNRLRSSHIAEAEIEVVGRGTLTHGSERGWFSTILSYLWPF